MRSYLIAGPVRAFRSAFTLIELLVVIVIIGILAAMLIPVLAKAKAKAQQVTCINNSKQVALAFHMYTDDMRELYPPNPDNGQLYNWAPGEAWGGMPNDPRGVGPNTFDPGLLQIPADAVIAPYIAANVDIFQCPADPRWGKRSDSVNNRLNGQMIHAARSVSLNQGVGTWTDGLAPTTGPWLTGSHGANTHDNPWATFGKTTDFAKGASPSGIFLMVDENPWSINDGALAVSAGTPEIVDWPSDLHDNGCVFSFCDGHAERHRWNTGLLHLTAPATTVGVAINQPDWNWLWTHATVWMLAGQPQH